MNKVLIIRKMTWKERLMRFFLLPFVAMRKWIIQRLLNWRARLQIGSLRVAIGDADKDKAKTGRKNMVVFNAHNGVYEPIQKRLLKAASNAQKNRSNKAMTEGRKRELAKQRQKPRVFDPKRVKTIEEKSLYVTK